MIMYNDVNTMVPHTRLSHSQEGTNKNKNGGLNFCGRGDQQVRRRDDEQDDEASRR